MQRVVVLALVLLIIAGAAAWYLGVVGPSAATLDVSLTRYDTNASGNADLIRERIGTHATIWRWDRDDSGSEDVVGYDVTATPENGLASTGTVGAWDYGADNVLDSGTVPVALQELMRTPEYAEARAAAGPGNVELVDAGLRDFVDNVQSGYDEWRLSDFQYPILGGRLPTADRLLPGAPRAYRFGVHQGFDMYPGYIGVPTGYGAPTVSVKAGTVVRADVDYVELTAEEYDEAIAISQAAGTTPEPQLDQLRGRQVWIDHGNGVISRYAHLSGIAPGIVEGMEIEAGSVVAFVGNSGMESASRGGDSGAHLHFELRIDGRYLGEGMSPDAIRVLAGPLLGAAE
ncbi:MAG: peptidoglycan DD-metalloendopeptidase family protein [Acidobacteria bacterium]|nr:peptidoglycan DD-metalloendopeptidase family protein [Acidobacteriota bacterium]